MTLRVVDSDGQPGGGQRRWARPLLIGSLMLNLLRAVQGIGGGMMFSTSLAIIAQTFQGKDRGIAFGIVTTNRAPPSEADSQRTSPLCRRAVARTTASPRPTPPLRRARDSSMRAKRSSRAQLVLRTMRTCCALASASTR